MQYKEATNHISGVVGMRRPHWPTFMVMTMVIEGVWRVENLKLGSSQSVSNMVKASDRDADDWLLVHVDRKTKTCHCLYDISRLREEEEEKEFRLPKQRCAAMSYVEAYRRVKEGYAVTFKTWGDQGFYVAMVTQARPIKGFKDGDIVRRWKFGRFYLFPMANYSNYDNWLIFDTTTNKVRQ